MQDLFLTFLYWMYMESRFSLLFHKATDMSPQQIPLPFALWKVHLSCTEQHEHRSSRGCCVLMWLLDIYRVSALVLCVLDEVALNYKVALPGAVLSGRCTGGYFSLSLSKTSLKVVFVRCLHCWTVDMCFVHCATGQYLYVQSSPLRFTWLTTCVTVVYSVCVWFKFYPTRNLFIPLVVETLAHACLPNFSMIKVWMTISQTLWDKFPWALCGKATKDIYLHSYDLSETFWKLSSLLNASCINIMQKFS